MHVPLGVLGFAGACAAALLLLKWTGGGRADEPADFGGASPEGLTRPAWLMPVLGASVLVMALVYTPRLETALAESPPAWEFPADLANEAWPLTAGELEWLSQAGITNAERWRFQWPGIRDSNIGDVADAAAGKAGPGLSGSMLLVSSQTWRAHHRPEACLEVYGFTVDHSFTTLVTPDFPVRVLALEAEQGEELATAVYWLQSPGQTTDDYAARIWADLAPERQRWVLITVLFDRPIDPQSPEAQAFYLALRASIQRHLEGGIQE
jgi:exosortase O